MLTLHPTLPNKSGLLQTLPEVKQCSLTLKRNLFQFNSAALFSLEGYRLLWSYERGTLPPCGPPPCGTSILSIHRVCVPQQPQQSSPIFPPPQKLPPALQGVF